jgi:hypothetical protein
MSERDLFEAHGLNLSNEMHGFCVLNIHGLRYVRNASYGWLWPRASYNSSSHEIYLLLIPVHAKLALAGEPWSVGRVQRMSVSLQDFCHYPELTEPSGKSGFVLPFVEGQGMHKTSLNHDVLSVRPKQRIGHRSFLATPVKCGERNRA